MPMLVKNFRYWNSPDKIRRKGYIFSGADIEYDNEKWVLVGYHSDVRMIYLARLSKHGIVQAVVTADKIDCVWE